MRHGKPCGRSWDSEVGWDMGVGLLQGWSGGSSTTLHAAAPYTHRHAMCGEWADTVNRRSPSENVGCGIPQGPPANKVHFPAKPNSSEGCVEHVIWTGGFQRFGGRADG